MVCSGALYCFITPDELSAQFDAIRQRERLHMVVSYFWTSPEVVALAPDQSLVFVPIPDAIFRTPSVPQVEGLSFNDLGALAFAEGWMYSLPGAYDHNVLYLTSITFKSPQEEARRLFQRIKRAVGKTLVSGVWVTGQDGAERRIVARYHCSPARSTSGSSSPRRQNTRWSRPTP